MTPKSVFLAGLFPELQTCRFHCPLNISLAFPYHWKTPNAQFLEPQTWYTSFSLTSQIYQQVLSILHLKYTHIWPLLLISTPITIFQLICYTAWTIAMASFSLIPINYSSQNSLSDLLEVIMWNDV